ncbi:hypothetical protein [Streptomyces sp. NPDC059894]|uniref:hypothetical protein n=1 Tax=unclassified Streptomyces TaxID=2593676 RepID=UPI0036501C42
MNARLATVSVVSAALVAAGAGAAVAAPKAATPTITLQASAPQVKVGQVVTLSGKTTGLKDGSKVTLQTKQGTKWVAVAKTATVSKSAYKLTDKFTKKGVQTLRVVNGKTASKAVSVTVR